MFSSLERGQAGPPIPKCHYSVYRAPEIQYNDAGLFVRGASLFGVLTLIKRVAITGISGYLGLELARSLELDPGVEYILGLDVKAPSETFSKLTFIQHDITKPFASLFLEHWVDAAVHLACSSHWDERERAARVNLQGTSELLEACHRSGVLKLLFVSCSSVYAQEGLGDDVVDESGHLASPNGSEPVKTDKVDQEARCRAFVQAHPEMKLTIARIAPLFGPRADHPLARRLRRRPLLLSRHMGAIQACHVSDAARALHQLLSADVTGVFNVGPNDAIEADALVDILGRRLHRVSPGLLNVLEAAARRSGFRGWSPVPPGDWGHSFPGCRISSLRLQDVLKFTFRHSSRQTLMEFGDWARRGNS